MRKAAFAFIFFTLVLDMLAIGMVAPVLPKLVIELQGGDKASAAAIVGVFGTVSAIMQFFFAPVLGALSDRFGRRVIILLSCLGLGLDYVLMALAPNLTWLLVGRIISGITTASYATAFAYVSDVTAPEQRAGRFGMLGAAFGIGFIIGPAVGGLLAGIGLRAPFWAAAGLSLIGAAYGFFVLPESLPPERRAAFRWRSANPMGAIHMLRSHGSTLAGLAVVAFLYRIAHDSLPSLFVIYADYRYQWTARDVGFALALVGVTSMIVQGVLIGRVVKRVGERWALLIGLGFGVIAMVMYAVAPNGAVFVAGIPVGALFGFAFPALQGIMTRQVAADEQGQLQGALASLMGISGVIAPVLFTQVFALAIGAYHGYGVPGAPFLLAALLLVIAAVTAAASTRKVTA